MINYQEKNILVVGGSSGIGLSLVKFLNENNARVYVISRTIPDDFPAGVKHLQADITGDLDAVVAFLPEHLHGLVYSVGSINLKPFNRLTANDFLNDYQLNVLGAVRMIQLSLKQLKNAGGASVVLISSVAARTGLPFHASISAAKSAIEGLALSLAAELAAQQIRVNVVAPSLTDTTLAQNLLNSPEKREASAKRHPLARYGQPEDVSQAIAFLLSDCSSWITGQVIRVDGGLSNLKTS
ncbi:SDR family NAD(P)-dependent oxidoreductase [Mucilaginibacter sp. SG564]|uniref:SDR family NAD(P)-dependent oxidoreductase n=1 Tax=Mucilaginibacter sp. SG564 TaxID=2587022 RepID=UPI001557D679|nr:SDR family oxidoreductase [Mucilaginibacter sp. SG564]NOW94289.1 NAD(P)-dependent dehydrogenase (short-subunit alcohol dehydrogenase family) [Mucilaginibacter sp. SG564]